jgi:8-oxo-dGTP diphosphatase
VLKIKPPNYQFCPFCGKKLAIRIEEEHERKFCTSCNWTFYPHVAASVEAIIIKEGRALMVRRRREPYKGTWMFPAGFVDFGEHPEETLVREIKEETGLKLKKATLWKVLQTEDDPRQPGHFLFIYKVKVLGSKLKTDEEENQGIGWFDLRHPPKIGWKAHKYVMKLLQKETRGCLEET